MSDKNSRRSPALKALRATKNPLQSQRIRTSLMLSARIAQGLKEKQWSKGQFAAAMGKNQSVVTRWLCGTHNFTSDTLSDIQEILGIQLLVRSEQERNWGVTNYTFMMVGMQQQMLNQPENLKQLARFAAESGGCTTGRFSISNGVDPVKSQMNALNNG